MAEQQSAFYRWLDDMLRERRMTRADLARELGVSQSTTTRWRQGGGVSLQQLQAIADYFGVARSTLEPLTGFPASSHTSADATADPALSPEEEAERATYRAFWERMLREVPRPLWKSYRDAVEAVATPFKGERLTPGKAGANNRGRKNGQGGEGGAGGVLTDRYPTRHGRQQSVRRSFQFQT